MADLETKAIRIALKLWPDHPAKIRVRNTRGGYAYKNGNITIPVWVMHSTKPGYTMYFIAHELAHIKAPWETKPHGQEFVEAFKSLCPKSYWRYEHFCK